jgi:hypothetical protein
VVGALVAGALVIGAGSGAIGSHTERHDRATAAGAQTTVKHETRPKVTVDGQRYAAANPYLGLLRDPASVDWAWWNAHLAEKADVKAQRRARKQAQQRSNGRAPLAVPPPFTRAEAEPAGTLGANDTAATGERITLFGTATGKRNAVRILGDLHEPTIETEPLTTTEDQGSIPLATDTGIPAIRDGVTIDSGIGNGPHGGNGDQSGDFDFFEVSAAAGQAITADTEGSALDTVLALWNADGELVAFNDDVQVPDLTSRVRYRVPADGAYFVMVGGFNDGGPLPQDPFDSGSGIGLGEQDRYTARITVADADIDHYAVQLRSGDVLGGVIEGGSPDLTVTRPDGVEAVSSALDRSALYPADSRLPGGGNATLAYVAEEPGWYTVSTADGSGAYEILLEAYRPGSTSAQKNTVQTVFLDFDGERVNTAVWGGSGVRTLSPFSSFVAKWGLTSAQQRPVVNRVIATVKENIRADLIQRGLNKSIDVKVLNSRDHQDPWGRPNVSRVIVGGTIAQSGIETIGISSSIDPGNFDGEDQALVMLDALSDPAEFEFSLNHYLDDSSDRVKFVGTAVGNVVSHEIGHGIGSFHVDQFNDVLNVMDQGGNYPLLYGVGDDGVGGTADDPDVDFGEDDYNPEEFFTGTQDTLNNSAWAFVIGKG